MDKTYLRLLATAMLFLGAACGPSGSSSQSAEEEDPSLAMVGVFTRGDAELTISEVADGPMGKSVEFQLSYTDTETSGTLFDTAEQTGTGGFQSTIEVLETTKHVDGFQEHMTS